MMAPLLPAAATVVEAFDDKAPRKSDGLLSRFEGRFAASADLVVTAVPVPAWAPEPGRARGPGR